VLTTGTPLTIEQGRTGAASVKAKTAPEGLLEIELVIACR
jgi:hypothetical protein